MAARVQDHRRAQHRARIPESWRNGVSSARGAGLISTWNDVAAGGCGVSGIIKAVSRMRRMAKPIPMPHSGVPMRINLRSEGLPELLVMALAVVIPKYLRERGATYLFDGGPVLVRPRERLLLQIFVHQERGAVNIDRFWSLAVRALYGSQNIVGNNVKRGSNYHWDESPGSTNL